MALRPRLATGLPFRGSRTIARPLRSPSSTGTAVTGGWLDPARIHLRQRGRTSILGVVTALTGWESFVLRHTRPGNLAVHFASMLLFFGSPLAALLLWSPWPLLGFAVSGAVGTAGHYLFHDGTVSVRESTSQPEVPYFVLVMFWKIARGTYGQEIAAARAKQAATRP